MKEIVKYDSPDSAKYVKNIEGWVSKNGKFFGKDEHIARWDGCTHVKCSSCGEYVDKKYSICEKCAKKRKDDVYLNYKEELFNWDVPLYSDYLDKFFFNADEFESTLEDIQIPSDVSIRDFLKLVICSPQYCNEINPYDLYCDILPEDDDDYIPLEIVKAFDNLNEVIKGCKIPVSWVPTNIKPKFK